MEEYIEILKRYLKEKRDMDKFTYKLIGRIDRAVKNGRTTWENELNKIGGVTNASN